MCGITGFLNASESGSHDDLEFRALLMTSTLVHRGPDDSGVWVDEKVGLALGHRRLSILDLSPEGHQPMISQSGRYVIAFNGEIYNFQELRAELRHFCSFRGSSDTEVMLAAFD